MPVEGAVLSERHLAELEKQLRPMATKNPPLVAVLRKPKAKWVEPKVLVEVAFPNISADGRLRRPSFKGIRDEQQVG
jgi:bifunctional non-homologous end joining protein LigD